MASVNIKDLPPKYRRQVKEKLAASTPTKTMEDRIEAAILEKHQRKSKYRANPVVIDGIRFDSALEGNYYCELKLREKAGEIEDLVLQPRFLLQEAFSLDGKTYSKIEYVGDFLFTENGKRVVVDTKGFRTDVYALKRKLFLYKYGSEYEFREVRLQSS